MHVLTLQMLIQLLHLPVLHPLRDTALCMKTPFQLLPEWGSAFCFSSCDIKQGCLQLLQAVHSWMSRFHIFTQRIY